ncbi:hypothetical protein [Flavobacterium sp. 83]|uniref:hypothetical protein n=1 Tax=Flavobacterium sp. 83 TaxID=1131812 RepID=UPI000551E6FA|nr:hypothetical protein [Flavobacterium sp. 83]
MITAENFLLNKVREIQYKQPTPKQVELWMEEFAEIRVKDVNNYFTKEKNIIRVINSYKGTGQIKGIAISELKKAIKSIFNQ